MLPLAHGGWFDDDKSRRGSYADDHDGNDVKDEDLDKDCCLKTLSLMG